MNPPLQRHPRRRVRGHRPGAAGRAHARRHGRRGHRDRAPRPDAVSAAFTAASGENPPSAASESSRSISSPPTAEHRRFRSRGRCRRVDRGNRPGVMERLGLGPAECAARNPRIVYGRMTGWGQDRPLALAAGHDPELRRPHRIALARRLRARCRSCRPPWSATRRARSGWPSASPARSSICRSAGAGGRRCGDRGHRRNARHAGAVDPRRRADRQPGARARPVPRLAVLRRLCLRRRRRPRSRSPRSSRSSTLLLAKLGLSDVSQSAVRPRPMAGAEGATDSAVRQPAARHWCAAQGQRRVLPRQCSRSAEAAASTTMSPAASTPSLPAAARRSCACGGGAASRRAAAARRAAQVNPRCAGADSRIFFIAPAHRSDQPGSPSACPSPSAPNLLPERGADTRRRQYGERVPQEFTQTGAVRHQETSSYITLVDVKKMVLDGRTSSSATPRPARILTPAASCCRSSSRKNRRRADVLVSSMLACRICLLRPPMQGPDGLVPEKEHPDLHRPAGAPGRPSQRASAPSCGPSS